jgi:large subunit ribosomal protein L21
VYAIIRAAGKQFRVTQNDIIALDRQSVDAGDEIVIDQVLLLSGDNGVTIGTPYVPGAKVVATVVRHYRGKKIRGFTYKPKKDLRRRFGHRQDLTSIKIMDIKTS